MVDWNKVRRTDQGLTEDEKEEVLNKLNMFIEQYRTTESVYVPNEDDGWDFWSEGENE